MSLASIDPTLLRRAFGAFVTGVTIITTRTASGEPVGLTVNSFNAVSLSPPLALWSLSRGSASFDAFVQASHFVVHVLAADQMALSQRFAKTGGDKFAGLTWRKALADVPLLNGVAASFVCRNAERFPGGDHLIFVGEILSFERSERAPLVYAGGKYARLHDEADAPPDDGNFAGAEAAGSR